MPFALPIADPVAFSPFWVRADPAASSLQLTAAIAAQAHRLAATDPAVAAHPWLAAATRFCLERIRDIDEATFAYEGSFALQFLDAAVEREPGARDLLEALGAFVPADGAIPVVGGAEGESLHLLDLAPLPGRPVRTLVAVDAVEADLDRLEAGQGLDGGWDVDFDTNSPAAALEWRGVATVQAVAVLRANGR